METKTSKARNTFNVVCLIRKNRVLKNGEVPMFMRITMKGQVADIPLAGTVLPTQWNQAKGQTNEGSRTRLLTRYIS